MNTFLRNVGFYLLIILIAISFIDYYSAKEEVRHEIEYTEFLQQIDDGQVSKVTMVENNISGTLADGTEFTTVSPAFPYNDEKLLEKMQEKGIALKAQNPPEPPWWMSLLSSIFPILLLAGVWVFIMQQSQMGGGKFMNFGKSRAKMNADKTKVHFDDVAGADEAKQELAEVVEFLKEPKKFNALGARIPKGVLLFGPPGTGKTLLAKAVAGEAGVPFFSISGSDFVEMFVGVGASRVRDLFDQAKKNAPCIIFIDEIDAVGRQRGNGFGGGHDEREQTLNQLLVEMDGFAANEGIIIIAATNRPDVLDAALLRPGRFDRQIVVDKPDLKGRKAILKVHTKGKPVDQDADLDILARRTPGFTGADLSNLVNEAALLAARRNKKSIAMQELEESIERVMAGPERKSKVMSEKEKRLTAYHEGGHTLVGMLLPNADPVHKVTIIPRGRAGGYTLMLPKEDRSYITRSELLDQLKTLLAGRVAEEVVLKEISTGASNDIQRASQLVRSMITEYGMSPEIGTIAYGGNDHPLFPGQHFGNNRNYSEDVAASIDREVRKYIEEAYEEAKKIITENIDKLHDLAAALMERETLDADELKEIVGEGNVTNREAIYDDDDNDDDDGPMTPLVTPLDEKANSTDKEQEEEEDRAPVFAPAPRLNAVKDEH